MKQTLLTVQEALNQITKNFLISKITTIKQLPKIYKKFSNELKEKLDVPNNKNYIGKIDLDKHFASIDVIRKYLISKNEFSSQEIENKINLLLSFYLPEQDELNLILDKKSNPFEFLKTLSLLSYYVKKDKNDLNLIWDHKTKFGNLKISINKAKPEKTLESIRLAKNAKPNPNKPKCVICVENVGYSADSFSDSRENLRIKYLDLVNGKWFFQYSPYSYLNNHFVLNNLIHKPMKISKDTVKNLVCFVKKYPNYFLGSNADLEIVGGSLLSHDHYQGGEDELPIMNAKSLKKYKVSNTEINILKWPLNTIKLSSADENEIIKLGCYFINNWKHLDDKNIITNERNNSSTLILNKKLEKYHLYIIFRNNSISKKRPYGNFHFHHNKFNIKQENIGLMEAAGLAILPQRLERELFEIVDLVQKNKVDFIKNNESLKKHYNWVKKLQSEKKVINKKTILKYASDVFALGLEDCKVLSIEKFIYFIETLIKNDEVKISNKKGLEISLLKQGFTFKDIKLKDKSFVLKYENKIDYYSNSILLNSFVAPIAGRIEGGIIKNPFNKNEIKLPTDSQNNYIHSMDFNLANICFNFTKIQDEQKYKLIEAEKKYFNEDLNIWYKFKMNLKVAKDKNEILIKYKINAENDFLANPTQHFYFRLPCNKSINDYSINLDNTNSIWILNKNLNPEKLQSFKFTKDNITIKDVAKQLNEEQHKIVGGLIDHPIKNSKKNVVLNYGKNKINLQSSIKDFVMYTHNFPSLIEKLEGFKQKEKNCGVCIEFQNIPTSKNNYNFDQIFFKKGKTYTNTIKLLFDIE